MGRLDDSALLVDVMGSFEDNGIPYSLSDLKYGVIVRTGESWSRKYLVSLLKDLEVLGQVGLTWGYEPQDSFLEMGK